MNTQCHPNERRWQAPELIGRSPKFTSPHRPPDLLIPSRMNTRFGFLAPAALISLLILVFSPKLHAATDAPPADVVPFAGLSPERAVKETTLPPGFKMNVFAAEPDVVQPIAFCLDHRGRVWVAEGLTYPRRRGNPPKIER